MSVHVYLHSTPDGTVFYVGQGTLKRTKNFRKGRNPMYKRIVAEHRGKISVEVLDFKTQLEARFAESFLIRSLRPRANRVRPSIAPFAAMQQGVLSKIRHLAATRLGAVPGSRSPGGGSKSALRTPARRIWPLLRVPRSALFGGPS